MNHAHKVAGYHHVRGVHCATAALRNMVRHATGLNLSEAMIFGIGSGLNFTYSRFGNSPNILTMGRGVDIEWTFADAMGINVESRLFDDRTAAWQYVRSHLAADRLVLLDTDMFSIPYFKETNDLRMTGIHFGGHKLLATGYDDHRQLAWVGDYAWDEQTLPYQILGEARGIDCTDPPMNRAEVFFFPTELLCLKTSILLGLERMRCLMRNSALTITGMRALERFCRQVTRWNVVLKEEFETSVFLAGHMMERTGTGGGNFRRFQSRFLDECAIIFADSRFNTAAKIYADAARYWRELAGLLDACEGRRDRGLFSPSANGVRLMDEIWRLENRGLTATEDVLRDHLNQFSAQRPASDLNLQVHWR